MGEISKIPYKYFHNPLIKNDKQDRVMQSIQSDKRFFGSTFQPSLPILFMLTAGLLLFTTSCDTHGQTVHSDTEYGVVNFTTTCSESAQEKFEAGLAHLHHMMYTHARSHFQQAADEDSECAMAYWGIAMTAFQPLWAPSSDEDLKLGKESSAKARAIGTEDRREQHFIDAVNAFFTDPVPSADDRSKDHQARIKNWLEAQKEIHEQNPDDVEAAAFYALSEIAYAMTQFSPHTERDFTREIRSGELMREKLEDYPEHPGLFHYLIHAYDSSELAHLAEDVALQYDQLAPDTPHALHMPSHIFVRLGHWENTAKWNERSAEAALQNPYNGLTSLHYPHALDYVMYAYLQLEDYTRASHTLERILEIEAAQPHFGSAYGIAAPQARYLMEQGLWEEASRLTPNHPAAVEWDNYPAASALFHYARGMGAAKTGNLGQAADESQAIKDAVNRLQESGDIYWSHMTEPLAMAIDAWILFEHGDTGEALSLIERAAAQEESMDKHPISPGETFPVRELHAEMLLLSGNAEGAHTAFQKALERTPNRLNALNGAEESLASM
jgi:tetratricopeptide (TPR) repeat protein